jgi:hypothetical protein
MTAAISTAEGDKVRLRTRRRKIREEKRRKDL